MELKSNRKTFDIYLAFKYFTSSFLEKLKLIKNRSIQKRLKSQYSKLNNV